MDPSSLRKARYAKFRAMGKFGKATAEQKAAVLEAHASFPGRPARKKVIEPETLTKQLEFIAEQTVNAEFSRYRDKAPAGCEQPAAPVVDGAPFAGDNAKKILDRDGPTAMATWLKAQPNVLVTDTTMRDAHQSLLATRLRTSDLLAAAPEFSSRLGAWPYNRPCAQQYVGKYQSCMVRSGRLIVHAPVGYPGCFSLECWGGATFDVAHRFLHEDAWERLRALRKAIPNVCFQMLIRGCVSISSVMRA